MRPIAVFLIVGSLAGCAARPPIAPGDYCLVQPLIADTGRGTFPLGEFRMYARVSRHDGQTFIDFSNSMPDSQQVLTAANEPARGGRDGTLRFDFIDGWENTGRGALTPEGVMTLDLVKRSPVPGSANIGRNYGRFALTAAACDHDPLDQPER